MRSIDELGRDEEDEPERSQNDDAAEHEEAWREKERLECEDRRDRALFRAVERDDRRAWARQSGWAKRCAPRMQSRQPSLPKKVWQCERSEREYIIAQRPRERYRAAKHRRLSIIGCYRTRVSLRKMCDRMALPDQQGPWGERAPDDDRQCA